MKKTKEPVKIDNLMLETITFLYSNKSDEEMYKVRSGQELEHDGKLYRVVAVECVTSPYNGKLYWMRVKAWPCL